MIPHLVAAAAAGLPDPPLDPDADEARRLLQRELLRPEYNTQDLLGRFLDWVSRSFDRGVNAAADAPPLSTFFALLIFAALVLAVIWLGTRARGAARAHESHEPLFEDQRADAATLRARAEAALASGDYSAAVLEGFRATAASQIESGRLPDNPGATAYEVVLALVATYPERADVLTVGGRIFDVVAYGDRDANREQAQAVLGIDDLLRTRR